MTYYYKGQKIRTSDRKYTHAVVIGDSVVACCGSKELAGKRARQEIIYRTEQYISNKNWYENHPEEVTSKVIEWLKEKEELINTIRVVELEVK